MSFPFITICISWTVFLFPSSSNHLFPVEVGVSCWCHRQVQSRHQVVLPQPSLKIPGFSTTGHAHTHTPKWGQGVFFTDGCGSLANCCEAEARRRRTLAVAVHEGQIGQRRGEDTKSFVWSWFRGKSIRNVTPVSRPRSTLAPLHLCKRWLREVIISL